MIIRSKLMQDELMNEGYFCNLIILPVGESGG
jgi:hypothetical protein